MTRRAVELVNVLILTPRYPPQVGGAATYMAMLARYLHDHAEIGRIGVLAPFVRGARIVERTGKLEIYRFMLPRPSRPVLRLIARLVSDGIVLVSIMALRLIRGYDVLHVHGSLSRVGAIVANRPLEMAIRLLGLRGVLDLRDPIVVPRRSAAWRATICASRSIEMRAHSAGISVDSCHYLPPPVDIARIEMLGRRAREEELSAGSNREYVCYVGEVTTSKGVRELIEAFRRFASAQPRFELVLVGPIVAQGAEDLTWGRHSPRIRALGGSENCRGVRPLRSSQKRPSSWSHPGPITRASPVCVWKPWPSDARCFSPRGFSSSSTSTRSGF